MAGLTGDARAELQPPPLPQLPPPPPVQLPPLPPPPPVPPIPALPALPQTPSLPAQPAAPTSGTPSLPALEPRSGSPGSGASSPTSSAGGSSGSSGGTASGGGAYGGGAIPQPRPSIRLSRVSSSRSWISRSGPRSRRAATLTFVLPRPAVVEFVVFRIAPDCTRVGSFRVAGRTGVNRVRFRGRVRGKALTPGTYLIRARAAGGRMLAKTRLVVFDRPPRPAELRAARSSNVCGGRADSGSAAGGHGLPGGNGAKVSAPGVLPVEGAGSSTVEQRGKPPLSVDVLGERFTRVTDAVKAIHPVFFVLLGVAIALLALAAIPARLMPNARAAALLAYRRGAVAFAGAAALVTVMFAYAVA